MVNMINKENAGKALLKYRSDKNITQAEIAKKAGISVQTISGIEGGNVPQSMTVYKLDEYFKSICYEVV